MARLIRHQRPRDVVGWNGEPAFAQSLNRTFAAHRFEPSKVAVYENRPIFGPDRKMIGFRVNAVSQARDLGDGLVRSPLPPRLSPQLDDGPLGHAIQDHDAIQRRQPDMPQTTIHGLKHEQLGRLLVPFERLNAGVSANDHLAFRETQRFKAIGLPAPEAAPDGARCGGFTRLLFTDIPQDIAQIFREGPKALAVSLSPSATLKMDQATEGVGSFSAFQTL